MLEPFYLPLDGADGERFHATTSTTGPWFADAQHAGPPSALLVRALERCPRSGEHAAGPDHGRGARARTRGRGHRCARRRAAGPLGRAAGRRAAAGGRVVLQGACVAAGRRRTPRTSPRARRTGPPPATAARAGARLRTELPTGLAARLHRTRWSGAGCDGWLGEPGPGTAWGTAAGAARRRRGARPLQRLAGWPTSANGAAAPLEPRAGSSSTPSSPSTCTGPRSASGWPWPPRPSLGPTGMGTVSGLLFDERGHTGRSAQSVVLRPCARRAQILDAGAVHRPAGTDLRGQDGAHAERGEVVHDLVGARLGSPWSAPRTSPSASAATRWAPACRA